MFDIVLQAALDQAAVPYQRLLLLSNEMKGMVATNARAKGTGKKGGKSGDGKGDAQLPVKGGARTSRARARTSRARARSLMPPFRTLTD